MIDKKRRFHTDQFTRGGQIFAHEWTMFFQNFKTVFLVSFVFGFMGLMIGSIWYNLSYWHIVDFYLISVVGGYLKVLLWPLFQVFLEAIASLNAKVTSIPTASSLVTDIYVPGKGLMHFQTIQYLSHPWTKGHMHSIHMTLIFGLVGLGIGAFTLNVIFRQKSKQLEKEQIVSGKIINQPKKVANLVKQSGTPQFFLHPDLPLPKGAENQHIAIIGATRMGKTNALIGLLEQVRAKGDRAIILDCTGELTERFFRKDHDKLLNPLDSRSEAWNIWSEDLKDYEYEEWASSMVRASKGNDPVWHESARKLLSVTALKLKDSPERNMQEILELACWKPISQVQKFYKNSAVAGFMVPEADRTAAGVRMNLAPSISAFEYLKEEDSFSIVDWVSEKETDQWLFLQCLPAQRRTMAPLLSSWFNFAFLGLERAGVDFDHRLWMVTDELPGLDYPIDSLKRVVAEGAKYGACCIFGFQNKSQLDHLYGPPVTKTIISNCSTKLIFRSPDHETAKDLSLTLGEQEIITSLENFSIGAHHLRDGVNLSSQQRNQAVITATDIMALKQLEAFISLPGDYPITKVKYTINKGRKKENKHA